MISESLPSIIIPAYNEEQSIATCLESLRGGLNPNFQVIVVCNGCSDRTEEIVENDFPKVHLLVLSEGSKSLAIRYAESKSAGFPRVYLDADIVLKEAQALKLIEAVLNQDGDYLTVPKSSVDDGRCSFLVKSYYQAWYDTDFVKKLGFGSGTYALSESARKRFGEWPELVSDDGFLRTQFSFSEIDIVEDVIVKVSIPRTVWQLILVKTRSKQGNDQLKAQNMRSKSALSDLSSHDYSVFSIHYWSYFVVNIFAVIFSKLRNFVGDYSWLRDTSNH